MNVTPGSRRLPIARQDTTHPPNQTAHTGKTDDQASTEQDRANVNTDHHSQG